ncbi:MAG: glycosyltransferase family 39 protein, partial [Chloroflexi bacterium]|nr:glycosyltransferase family 39 protein [Chloroflexota bacterium]
MSAIALKRPAQRTLKLPATAIIEFALLAVVVAVALFARLPDPEGHRSNFPDLFDEGIRAEQLLLMEHGFRPFRDIYAAQGPLLLDLLYPLYILFGGTLGAARLAVGLFSVVGIVGAWFVGRQVGGRVGGLLAAVLLTLSPVYLEGSRLALAEVPSIAPALLAIGCALRWRHGGGRRWLVAMAILGTTAFLVKPMALPVALPLLLLLFRPGLRRSDVLLAAGLAVGFTLLVLLALGPAEVWDQIVNYRLGASEGGQWNFAQNYKTVVLEPVRAQSVLYLVALVGAVLLLLRDFRSGLALTLFELGTVALLVRYYPLHPKHLVYLYPPLCLLAGAGLGEATRLARLEGERGLALRLASVGAAALLAAWHLTAYTAGTGKADPNADISVEDDADLHSFDEDASRGLALLAQPDEFVLTDYPYVAALARRLVPPDLVDPSKGRMRAGVLNDRMVYDTADRFDVHLILIWADRFKRLGSFPTWLERNYQPAQVFGTRIAKNRYGKDRTLYIRKDADLAAARASLEQSLAVHQAVDFQVSPLGAAPLRWLGHRVSKEAIGPRDQFTLTMGIAANSAMDVDYHIT